MAPKSRGSIAFQLSLLAGGVVLGAVVLLVFLIPGVYASLPIRALVIGFVIGPGAPVVIRLAERVRSKAVRGGEFT